MKNYTNNYPNLAGVKNQNNNESPLVIFLRSLKNIIQNFNKSKLNVKIIIKLLPKN